MSPEQIYLKQTQRWTKFLETEDCPYCDHHRFTIRLLGKPDPHWRYTCNSCKNTWRKPSK